MAYLCASLFQAKGAENIGINGWKAFQFAKVKIFLKANRIGFGIIDPTGKVKSLIYSFVTDLNPFKDNIKILLGCGRN